MYLVPLLRSDPDVFLFRIAASRLHAVLALPLPLALALCLALALTLALTLSSTFALASATALRKHCSGSEQ
jgi:hypothetical protein